MEKPSMFSILDYQRYAVDKLGRAERAYFFTGSVNEQTSRDNVEAFARYRFRPRVLRDVSQIDMSTTVLGHPVSCPVGVAPMANCCMLHPDGELGIAKACGDHNLPFSLSTASNVCIEDIAAGAPNTVRWFQLYIYKERRLTESLVRRAEDAGFSALVLTVDAQIRGRRIKSKREGITFPKDLRLENLESSDIFKKLRKENPGVPYMEVVARQLDTSLTWDDVEWLLKLSRLPVIVKGIMTGEDAREAVSRGVAAVWVSNHGGRQLDGVPATLDVLSEVVDAVEGRCEVYMDGGVRSGYDVTKALALGARAVFVGQPALWGLIYKGTAGVTSLLQLVKDEMVNAMALLGAQKLSDLSGRHVIHESRLPKL